MKSVLVAAMSVAITKPRGPRGAEEAFPDGDGSSAANPLVVVESPAAPLTAVGKL